MREGQARSKGLGPVEIEATFRVEIADVVSHALSLAQHHGIDILDEIERKWLVRRSS